MYVIVCLDERGGMAFNHRRQSRDRTVAENICRLVKERQLWMNESSAKLFQGLHCAQNIHVSADFLDEAPGGAFCFVEDRTLQEDEARIEGLTIYYWNRHYPADLYFDLSLEGWKKISSEEFAGHSHDKITREDYVR